MNDEPVAGPNSPARRVTETGLALIHRGELVLPAAGSEAQAAQVGQDLRQEVHYHFPVEVVVLGERAEARSDPPDVQTLIAELVRQLKNQT